jgi:hypothetical protein
VVWLVKHTLMVAMIVVGAFMWKRMAKVARAIPPPPPCA